mgnify:CR=1 FL=1
MKKLMKALPLLALLCSGVAYAEDPLIVEEENKETNTQDQLDEKGIFYWASKPIQCSGSSAVIGQMKKHGEVPTIWMNGMTGLPNGVFSPSKFVITMNVNVTPVTWTLIEFIDGQNQACILGFGKGDINIQLLEEDIMGLGA